MVAHPGGTASYGGVYTGAVGDVVTATTTEVLAGPAYGATSEFSAFSTVTSTNAAPVLDPVGAQLVDETVLLAFTASASDTDLPAQTLTFSLQPGIDTVPAGAAITAGGNFTWTPTETQGGATYSFKIRVTDDGTGTLFDEEEVAFTVNETNVGPAVTNPGNQTDAETDVISLFVAATDADLPANTLTWSASGLPGGLTINTSNGEISGTLTYTSSGSFPVSVTATDDGTPNLAATVNFTWDVTNTNRTPTLDPVGDSTIAEQTLLSFTATGSDPDLDGLTFSLTSEPVGAAITAGGAFTFTPTEAQGPGSYTFDVIVTDDGAPNLADTETITITVTEANAAPVVTNPVTKPTRKPM